MTNIYVKDLIDKCGGKLLCGDENKRIENCFVDSRVKTNGGTFFGIKGKKVNASLYYKEAFDNGASVCVISNIKNIDANYHDKTIVIVDDVLEALKKIAAYKRSLFDGEVIGITGSVGKTCTKELIYNVLKKKYKVLKTLGNQNSQIGLPLTILRLTDEQIMVLEMGMSRKGEMHNLSMIAKPDIAVITNVFDSHIGNLGSRENILKAKLEIIDGMDDGTLIINNDNDMLKMVKEDVKPDIKVMTYGIENKSNVMPCNIKEDITTSFDIDDVKDFMIKGNKAFIHNVLASYLVSKLLGISRGMIKKGINEYAGENHRLEVIHLNNNLTLIDDAYNSSYYSTKMALDYIKSFSGKKIVVLGDILELGKESKKAHKKIGKMIADCNIDELITVGKYSKYMGKEAKKGGMKGKNIKHFKNEAKTRKFIKSILKDYNVILIKGSNGMNLINLVNYLKG